MRRTPHRRTAATGSFVAIAALLAVGIQAANATAETDERTKAENSAPMSASAKPNPGALPVKLSPAQRAGLLHEADATKVQTAKTLRLGAKEKLVVKDVSKDADGTTHTRYERTYDGLPVLGGDLVVDEAKSGKVEAVTKAVKAQVRVASTTAAVRPAAAEEAAERLARADDSKKAEATKAPRKVVWAAAGKPVLAYETIVGGFQKDGTPNELHVITDATTGKKLFEYQGVHNGTGNSQYSGQVPLGTAGSSGSYSLTDTNRGSHKTYNLNRGTSGQGTLFTDADDTWGDGTGSHTQTAAVDAHYGAALTWDYYKNVHGRSGIRGDGVGAYSRVHYGNNYVNAFWTDSCFCMTYGDGSGNTHPLTSIDVAAHEMTHGVTANTAKLVYSGESGGLNEATSDIFAAAVEFDASNPNDKGDYWVGEEIDINGNGTPLRYMDKPSKDGKSKDNWYSGIGGIDVHYSSGVANHWFYLASEGSGAKVINGLPHDSPTADNQPVTAIGRVNAEKVWFKALSQRMQSNTDYKGARDATLWAAGELFGVGSTEYNGVANAWAGVAVGARVPTGVTVTAPGDQSTQVGQAASLQIKATSGNAGALRYAASGLPAGLEINSATGLISGTPTTAGTSQVTVTVTDAANKTGTASFKWVVTTDGGGDVFENAEDVQITDGGAAVTSPIAVTRSGNASSTLKVGVDIVHTYRGDLVIDLVAPDGTSYRLKNSSAYDSADNVQETYTVNASSEAASGTWKLKVQDIYSTDRGHINSWKLTF
ncbi:M4 family metallopeptidase [Streptomyces zagrosensis]|uniref:Zn-dependent metalloprotease/subtilisin-like proprotein convertase family protein n=1 Tax=Streptomyces zagrosensis TaxID=1042984 RepID=A0A7W9UYD5_9ACTN|nr:M4 family metallopeptidase [Streptomyces zagrosensis]MBB5935838.1 Zn-dependent metalloprotease/subtilisin-like proprotein convertase family protein [Streptomyces zagrosensis]